MPPEFQSHRTRTIMVFPSSNTCHLQWAIDAIWLWITRVNKHMRSCHIRLSGRVWSDWQSTHTTLLKMKTLFMCQPREARTLTSAERSSFWLHNWPHEFDFPRYTMIWCSWIWATNSLLTLYRLLWHRGWRGDDMAELRGITSDLDHLH